MKKIIIKGEVITKEQLKNSKEGGPRVRFVFRDRFIDGDYEELRERTITTATNSSAGYCLTCSMEFLKNKELALEVHYSGAGRWICDRILSGYFGG